MKPALRALLLTLLSFVALPGSATLPMVAGPRHVATPPVGGDGCSDPQTALEITACGLAPGDSATGPAIAALIADDTRQTIQWGNRFHYDHQRGIALLVGKDASAGGGDGARSLNIYNAALNTWTTSGRFHIDGSVETGHLYESFGYDPVSGTIYVGRWGDEFLQTWTIGSPLNSGWGTTSTFVGHWMPNSTPQQVPNCWHPNLYGTGDGGLVIVRNVNESTDMELLAWRKSTDTYASISSTQHDTTASPQAGACVYARSGDYVIAGSTFGNFYRMPAGSGGSLGAVTQVDDPPVILRAPPSASATIGMLMDDPLGAAGPYILEKSDDNEVWQFNAGTNAWDLKGYTHDLPQGSATDDAQWYVAPLYPLGVFWAVTPTGTPHTFLWRPND